MRLRINIYTIASAALSMTGLTAFWLFSRVFGETLIFYLGIPFALSTFFLFLRLLYSKTKKAAFKVRTEIANLILYPLSIIAIFSVLLVPPFDRTLELMRIPLLNGLRYFSSVVLTSFLLGYFLLKILDRNNSITGCPVIVLSYLLSLFVTFFLGFTILMSGNSISVLGTPTVAIICLALMILCHVTRRNTDKHFILGLDLLEVGLILTAFGVVILGSATIMMNTLPLRWGDMMGHHGTALQFLEHFPAYNGRLTIYAGGYLFSIYLAVLFALSGIHSALAEQGLFVISFIPLLAFYSAIKAWFRRGEDNEFPALALFLSTLLGFGGLYALHSQLMQHSSDIASLLQRTTSKTYDVYMRILYLPDNVAPIFYIGLPVFFSLLYLLKQNRARNSVARALIVSLLVAVGYMGHASEVIFFLATLFIYAILLRRPNEPKMGLCVLLGLLVVSALDLVAPAQIYVLSKANSITPSSPFFLSVTLGILTYIIETMKDKRSIDDLTKFKTKIFASFEMLWRYAKWCLLYSYLFSVVIWLTVVNGFSLWAWGGTAFTPFFVLPIRLGPVGLLAIISIVAYLPTATRNRNLFFFLSLIPLGFILEQLANYYPSVLTYPSYRYGTLTFIGCCLIASYGVIKILSSGRTNPRFSPIKRKIMVCVLLTALLISGFLTTTLYYTNASMYNKDTELSEDELNALNYIRLHLPRNASVLTFTDLSAHRLRTFAGINAVQDAQRWSKNLLETMNPYIMTYILASSNVRYVYVSEEDSEELKPNNILSSLIEYLPKNFENKIVTIYESPPLNPPSQQANLGLFHLPRSSPPENVSAPFSEEDVIPALFAASLKTEYSTIYVDKLVEENLPFYLSKYKYVLLNLDPKKPLDDLLEWTANGNTLIVLNSRGYGFFAQLQSLGDFITEEKFGSGKIVYLDIFSAIESNNLLEVLRPDSIEEVRIKASILEQHAYRISALPVYNSTFYDIVIQGNLTLKSDLITLKGSINFQDTSISAEDEFNEIRIFNEASLSINASELNISPLESYLSVKSKAASIRGKIKLGSKSLLAAFDEEGASKQKVKLEGARLIRFTADPLLINARLPQINISGTATFDCLDVHSALYIPLEHIVQEKASVKGIISFGTRYISKPVIMFSNFQVDGQVRKMSDDIPDRSIPWVEAFVSPYNLILILTICSGAILDFKRKKAHIKLRPQESHQNLLWKKHEAPYAESGSLKDYKRQIKKKM